MQSANDPEAASPGTLDRSKILVVNDSPDFLAFMREFLTLEGGFDVATLDQSEGVIEQVTNEPPDLIILDIVFRGGASGVSIAGRLADAAATAGIPILFCTALGVRDIAEDVRTSLDQRQYRVLYKPFDVDELLSQIEALLQLSLPA